MSTEHRSESPLYGQPSYPLPRFNTLSKAGSYPDLTRTALSLFEPDVLLPVQYYDTARRKEPLGPERELMLAVLQDAICCFQTYLLTRDKEKAALFREAERWLMEEKERWLFSFESICGFLNLEPSYLRQGLRRWKEKQLAEQGKARPARLVPGELEPRPSAHEAEARERVFPGAAGF